MIQKCTQKCTLPCILIFIMTSQRLKLMPWFKIGKIGKKIDSFMTGLFHEIKEFFNFVRLDFQKARFSKVIIFSGINP